MSELLPVPEGECVHKLVGLLSTKLHEKRSTERISSFSCGQSRRSGTYSPSSAVATTKEG